MKLLSSEINLILYLAYVSKNILTRKNLIVYNIISFLFVTIYSLVKIQLFYNILLEITSNNFLNRKKLAKIIL